MRKLLADGAAVDAQTAEGTARFGHHGVDDVARLVRQRLERGAHDVRPGHAAGQADERAARRRVPVRRAETDEGRHQIDAEGRVDCARQLLRFLRVLEQAEAVAQPLHGGAGDEHRAFDGIRRTAVGARRPSW